MMDAFYEESAVNQNAKKGEKRYKIVHIVSMVFLVLGILLLIICLFFIPIKPNEADFETQEKFQQAVEAYAMYLWLCIFSGFQGVFFMLTWLVLSRIKKRINVNYDYVFVSGELRIAKVFNINRRKLVARIDCADMLQVGDIDNSSYERLRSDPSTKEVICTPNDTAAEGKFFMYILAAMDGKKLYVLECRENLLMNIMKFAKRSTLESDYVMQERKQK